MSSSFNAHGRAKAQALVAQLRHSGVRCASMAVAPAPAIPQPNGMEWLLGHFRSRDGFVSEWIAEREGSGVVSLALAALRGVRRPEEPVVLIEGERPICPAAFESLGFPLANVVLLRPASNGDRAWVIEQALRCRGIGGVVAWVGPRQERLLRRLQLAVEQGRGRGFLIRPEEARCEKCSGDVRFLVHPRPSEESDLDRGRRRVEIEVLAGRGGIAVPGQTAVAELCDVTGAVCLVPRLADSARAVGTAGA